MLPLWFSALDAAGLPALEELLDFLDRYKIEVAGYGMHQACRGRRKLDHARSVRATQDLKNESRRKCISGAYPVDDLDLVIPAEAAALSRAD